MYTPKSFEVTDLNKIKEFIQQNSFAIMVSKDGDFIASHLPLIYDESNNCLIGHMAKANTQWKLSDTQVVVIFSGPHSYISPSWYKEDNTVPTWNYISVHAYGQINIVNNAERSQEIIAKTVSNYENSFEEPWSFSFDTEFISKLMEMIVCFEIQVNKWEGKWKLSQNHSINRQKKVIEGLLSTDDSNAIAIANLMKNNIRS